MCNTNLKARRTEKKKTQAEVAKAAGISARSYQNYELGTREPAVTVAIRIADALGTDVKALFAE